MKLCDAFFVTSRQFYIDSWLQNFGFSEHPRKLPKGLIRVITESAVPIGKTARSQYVDFHTSCESPHKNQQDFLKFACDGESQIESEVCVISS